MFQKARNPPISSVLHSLLQSHLARLGGLLLGMSARGSPTFQPGAMNQMGWLKRNLPEDVLQDQGLQIPKPPIQTTDQPGGREKGNLLQNPGLMILPSSKSPPKCSVQGTQPHVLTLITPRDRQNNILPQKSASKFIQLGETPDQPCQSPESLQ